MLRPLPAARQGVLHVGAVAALRREDELVFSAEQVVRPVKKRRGFGRNNTQEGFMPLGCLPHRAKRLESVSGSRPTSLSVSTGGAILPPPSQYTLRYSGCYPHRDPPPISQYHFTPPRQPA